MGLKGNDEEMLQRALELAREAAAFASPNPAVGCVLMRHGRIVGEGAHKYDAMDHAEIVAMKDAAAKGEEVRGATAYVTLEPCSHHGRTGPCADALIAAGVTRCVVAMIDPNPEVSGSGLEKMRKRRMVIDVANRNSDVAKAARKLNEAYAYSMALGRPFVTLKAALSLDEKLAPADASREARKTAWLTGPAARQDVQTLRHGSDAILSGIGTVLADDPSLTDRTGLPRRKPLLRVVLDGKLRMPLDSAILKDVARDLLIVTSKNADREAEAALIAKGAEVLRVGQDAPGDLSLSATLRALQARGVLSVLLECGSALNGAFLSAGLVDRIVFYFNEETLGKDAVPFAQGGFSPKLIQDRLLEMEKVSFAHEEGSAVSDVKVSGYLRDPFAKG